MLANILPMVATALLTAPRDLEDHGHRVWLDLNSIEKGGLFEVRIEQGIRDSHVVAAVMTQCSMDEHSVCRDEIVIALLCTEAPLRLPPFSRPAHWATAARARTVARLCTTALHYPKSYRAV